MPDSAGGEIWARAGFRLVAQIGGRIGCSMVAQTVYSEMATTPAAGSRFGRLVVTGDLRVVEEPRRDRPTPNRRVVCECRCDCGKVKWVQARILIRGHSRSCGCLQPEAARRVAMVRYPPDGGARRRRQHLKQVLRGAVDRCHNPKAQAFDRYGARGIEVCPEWRENFDTFHAWAMASGYSDGATLDRENNDGPYSPDNCRWATYVEQNRNRRDNVVLTAFGEAKPLSAWVEDPRCKFSRSALRHRMERGLSFEEALTLPRQPPGRPARSAR